MKEYQKKLKESGGNVESSSKSPKKSKSIKDMMKKVDKSGIGDKFKSKEYIDTSDDSSSDDDKGSSSQVCRLFALTRLGLLLPSREWHVQS